MLLTDSLTPAALKTNQSYIDGLNALGLKTVLDLLLYLPRAHEDLNEVMTLMEAPLGQKVTLRGMVSGLKMIRTRSGKTMIQAVFTDESGQTAQAIWFNQPHILRMLKDGQAVTFTGKIVESGYKLQIQSPTFEDASRQPLHAGRIVPVYPQSDMIHSRWLREKMVLVQCAIEQLQETLPQDIVQEEKLLARKEAIREMHFPKGPDTLLLARDRLAFEELFAIQQDALERKRLWQGERQSRLKIPMDVELVKAFFASLHYTPTGSQKVAIYEILKDMEKDIPMSRLLEGDVGSGKTLVAVTVIANVIRHGGQCALMVPTEVLAKQHSLGIARLLLTFHSFLQTGLQSNPKPLAQGKPMAVGQPAMVRLPTIALLTGSTPTAEANAIRLQLAAGLVDLVIGTHALIEDKVQFKDLQLAIVDEQHRFGVMQRQRLKDKGNPHFLAMTATPIPRTLALTAYGDHDLSVLTEKPGNRRKIETKVVSPTGRHTVELFIDQQIGEGRQVFVICPLISESSEEEMMEVKNVTDEMKRLQEAFPRRKIAMLHGKMAPAEKEDTMTRFKDRAFDILVSTSVIEVGIDVPNSTIIVIEGSERFGLAQLHQFRGRVGRSDAQSYCFLFTTSPAQARSQRLKAMEEHDSGFLLAEIDLKLRGPGEVFGLRQSGIPDMKFGSLLNVEMVVRARKAAEKYLLNRA